MNVVETIEWPITVIKRVCAAWDGFSASLMRGQQDLPTDFVRLRNAHSLFFNPNARSLRMESRIEGGPNRQSPLPSKAWTLVPTGMTLRGVNYHDRAFDYLFLSLDPSVFDELTASQPAFELLPRLGSQDPVIKQSAEKLQTALQTDGAIGRLYAAQIGDLIASELVLRHSSVSAVTAKAAGGLSPAALKSVLDYLHAHLTREPELTELISLSRVSRAHFFRAFKQSTGMSPERYLNALRVDVIKQTIAAHPDIDDHSLATASGLGGVQRLRAVFIRMTGRSIAEFRKEMREP